MKIRKSLRQTKGSDRNMSIRRVTTLFTVTVALIAVVIGGLAYGMKLVLDDFAAAVQQKETAGALARGPP